VPKTAPRDPEQATVEEWLQTVRHDIATLGQELSPLLERQAKLREREELLLGLLASFQGRERPVTGGDTVRDYVLRAVAEILDGHGGGPLHINTLHQEFLRRGLRVPGAGTPANLTAHLSRAPNIVRTGRGLYALAVVRAPRGAAGAARR
jgi:hypothetical protein